MKHAADKMRKRRCDWRAFGVELWMRIKKSERRDDDTKYYDAGIQPRKDEQACDEKQHREPKQTPGWHLRVSCFHSMGDVRPVVQGEDMSNEQDTSSDER